MDAPYDKVLMILNSQSHSLKELAKISGLDPRRFYQGADLRCLNLSKQDLTGLNFDGADFRGADLTKAQFTGGAMNNAKLDEIFESLKDEYDCYIDDADIVQVSRLTIYARFRLGLFDRIADFYPGNLNRFSEDLQISTSTLRRVRNSDPVSLETVKTVLKSISVVFQKILAHHSLEYGERISELENEVLFQPCVQFGEFNWEQFVPIQRGFLLQAIDNVEELNSLIGKGSKGRDGYFRWTIKPSNLGPYLNYYRSIYSVDSRFIMPPIVTDGGNFNFPLFTEE